MKPGDRFRVSGALGVDECVVLQVAYPDELPEIEALGFGVEHVKRILHEFEVDLLLLLAGRLAAPVPVCFFAFRLVTGEWRDTKQQTLTLEPLLCESLTV